MSMYGTSEVGKGNTINIGATTGRNVYWIKQSLMCGFRILYLYWFKAMGGFVYKELLDE